jgi:hypothetical protein
MGDKIRMNHMSWACSRYGGRICVYRTAVGKPEGKDYLEDIGIDVRIILK